MLLASWISVAFLLGGVAAWRLLRNAGEAASRLMLRSALTVSLCILPLQMVVGDLHGENTVTISPLNWRRSRGGWQPHQEGEPLRLFALPDRRSSGITPSWRSRPIGSLCAALAATSKACVNFRATAAAGAAGVFAFRLMVGLALLC